MTPFMANAPPLLDRPTYAFSEVDDLLRLSPGTARRWIDGYERQRRWYDPVIRLERTGEEVATWGEFVEARLLAEYRGAGVSIQRLRGAVLRLRDEFGPLPLARAEPYLDVEGRELVRAVQDEVNLEAPLQLVVVRNDQLLLAAGSQRFVDSVEFGGTNGRVVERVHPEPDLHQVILDPLRRAGQPVVRAVPTEVIAEQIRAGDSIATIVEAYELDPDQVEAAIRFELLRAARAA